LRQYFYEFLGDNLDAIKQENAQLKTKLRDLERQLEEAKKDG